MFLKIKKVEWLERLFQWNALKPIAHQNKGFSLVPKRNDFLKTLSGWNTKSRVTRQLSFILTTLGDCIFRMLIPPFVPHISWTFSYAQFSNGWTIKLHEILTLHFCQTSKHRHEILSIWGVNFAAKTVWIDVREFYVVCSQFFGVMHACHMPK